MRAGKIKPASACNGYILLAFRFWVRKKIHFHKWKCIFFLFMAFAKDVKRHFVSRACSAHQFLPKLRLKSFFYNHRNN